MVRPKKEIDWTALDAVLRFKPSMVYCADHFEMSVKTIERGIRKKYDMTFLEYRAKKMEGTILKLQQTIISKALNGDNTSLIFSLKNIANWTDKQERELKGNLTLESILSDSYKED